jgi:hypothetical protein
MKQALLIKDLTPEQAEKLLEVLSSFQRHPVCHFKFKVEKFPADISPATLRHIKYVAQQPQLDCFPTCLLLLSQEEVKELK